MEDVTVLTSRLDETIEEWHREAVAEGLSEGLARQRGLIRLQTETRFGREAAQRVGALIEDVDDWDVLQSVGNALLSAGSAAALVDRTETLVGR